MFEKIGTLLVIAFWVVTIFSFVGGIIICISNIFTGGGWEKLCGIIAVILGVVAFYYMYKWFESIPWCMLISGFVLCAIGSGDSEKAPVTATAPKQKYGVADAFLDAYIEEKVIEEAVENGIRKANEWK